MSLSHATIRKFAIYSHRLWLPYFLGLLSVSLFCNPVARANNPVYTIDEVQFSNASLNWESPHYGEIVDCVGGVVTHKFRQRIILQDPALGGQWAAIEIRGYPVYPTGLEVGDQVDLQSVYVDEFRGVTVLQYYNASSYVINSSANPVPDPLALTLADIAYPPDPAISEPYASMLVSFLEPIEIGQMDLGAHEDNYELLGETDVIAWGSDYGNTDIETTYYVATGERYGRLTGIIQRYLEGETWDSYQLLPRAIADYELASAVDNLTSPIETKGLRLQLTGSNPSDTQAGFQISLNQRSHLTVEILDICGRRVNQIHNAEASIGTQHLIWNGNTSADRQAPTGIYLIKASTETQTAIQRILLTR